MTLSSDLAQTILSITNFENAYLKLVRGFDESSRSQRYRGIDGVFINKIDCNSLDVLNEACGELKQLQPLLPAMQSEVPKKDGSARRIFTYTIKDRLKAEAIYQVLLPVFENIFSPFLFSYRSSHPHYLALQSVFRRYHKCYSEDTIWKADISDYTENIDHAFLQSKLRKTGLPDDVLRMLDLFIGNFCIQHNTVVYPKVGLITGVPLIGLFANLYLTEIDKHVGKKIALYRRVGDDFILLDKSESKILEMRNFILQKTRELKLTIKEAKTNLIRTGDPFVFIGYRFHQKKVQVDPQTIRKFEVRWKRILKYYPVSIAKKLRQLPNILYSNPGCLHDEFVNFISTYRHAKDEQQIQRLSQKCFRFLTQYFFENYSPRLQRKTQDLTRKIQVPSLYRYYLEFHYGKKTLASLALQKKKRRQTGSQTHAFAKRANSFHY